MTDFSVNASSPEIAQASDDEGNWGPPPQTKLSRNAVNIDEYFKTSKDVFDKNINLLVPDAEKQDQSG